MTAKPPPFVGFRSVSDKDTWEKILSGDVAAFIYSTKAKGDLAPVPISPAQFFLAEQSGQTADDGDPDRSLEPYQIMWRDRDGRRAVRLRHRIPVPHWVYVLKALPKIPAQDKERNPAPGKAKAPRTPPEQARTTAIIQTLFGSTIPPELGFGDLLKRINDYACKTGRAVTKDTLRRTLKELKKSN